LADGVLAVGIFVVVLIVASLITIRLSDQILDSRVGALDRTMGFVFGLFRGLILVVISYELVALIVERKDFPSWVQNAQSYQFIESTGDAIISILPDNPASLIKGRDSGGAADERTDAGDRSDRGYAFGDRRVLDDAVGAATRPR
jgi:membrane protein required for colicin V production